MDTQSSFVEALTPKQTEHFLRILTILSKFTYALDLSPLGSGKSFIASAVCQAWKFKRIVIICPATVEYVWDKLLGDEKYPLPDLIEKPMILSYEMFRSSKKSAEPSKRRTTLSHGLLEVATTAGIKPGSVTLNYYPTDKLRGMIQQGCLFVFDEAHRGKNANMATSESMEALIRTVNEIGGWSRTLILTGTLYDKKEHAFNLGKLLGIVNTREPAVFDRITRSVRLTGVNDIIFFCKTKIQGIPASDPTPDYGQRYVTDKNDAIDLAFNLMKTIIIPAISSCISVSKERVLGAKKELKEIINCENEVCKDDGPLLDCKNLFVQLSPEDDFAFQEAITTLGRALKYNPKNKTIDFKAIRNFGAQADEGEGNLLVVEKLNLDEHPYLKTASLKEREEYLKQADWGVITKMLMKIEKTKIASLISLAVNKIQSVENSKVVVVVNYLDSLGSIYRGIKEAVGDVTEVGLVYGATSKANRRKIFDKFQENNGKMRVLVANLHVIALGVSLDDQVGDWPRYAFASPSYYSINQHQFVRRFYRMNTKSLASVRFVYGAKSIAYPGSNDKVCEAHIINALSKKANVMKSTLPTGEAEKILFADEYEKEEGGVV